MGSERIIGVIVLIVGTALLTVGQMGLADEIISLAFGLTFGAAAVAVAIAFGLGGRDLAGRKLQEWEQSLQRKQKESR